MKLGSLFDGVGGFPLAGLSAGIKPVWASEIEPFPISITKRHFPDMKHLGDVTQIKGSRIEPVDIITFGSPCQDLSVAGKQKGLAGERSGLFMEAVRIIREMRARTNGIYPRIAIWENVPGAFSSNNRQDFRAVLEEIMDTKISMPKSGRWATAGMVRGNGRSVAWRTLDAQYWGVPQRRRRIYLVADFRGQCAPEILFECQSVSGNSAEGRETREEVAATVGDSTQATVFGIDQQGGKGNASYTENVSPTLCADSHGTPHAVVMPVGFRMTAFGEYADDDSGSCLKARDYKDATDLICEPQMYDMTHADEVMRPVKEGISPTLNARMGTGGNQVPVLMEPIPVIQNATRGKNQNGLGISEDVCYTLDQLCNHAVATVDCRNLCENQELSGTLQAKNQGGHSLNYINPVRVNYAVRRLTPTECERLQGLPDNWTEGGSDSARYKAIGNGLAVPNPTWILQQVRRVIE